MLHSVDGAIGVHVRECQVFHAQVQQLRIFEQRDPHLSQVESHKQDSLDISIKDNRGSVNRDGPRNWPTTPNPSRPKRGIQVSTHIAEKFCDKPFVEQEITRDTFLAQLPS
ncbi:uncharacterized protein TNCV_4560091 [Trichonephila clavipes]|nr:uncharacterized protein TNCV_4560091 [Trichonephila clavipes]